MSWEIISSRENSHPVIRFSEDLEGIITMSVALNVRLIKLAILLEKIMSG